LIFENIVRVTVLHSIIKIISFGDNSL